MICSWEGDPNLHIQLAKVLYCKMLTNGNQLLAFALEFGLGFKIPISKVEGSLS